MGTLVDKDNIVHNFRNMDQVGFAFNNGSKGNNTSHLIHGFQWALPSYFTYNNQSYNMTEWLSNYSTTGLVVLKIDNITKARILHEQYFLGNNKKSQVISWSTGKSIVSALIGIAIKEGKIKSINDNVADYAIELKNSSYDGITIKNVLQMSSGVDFDENYFDFWSDINKMGRYIAFGVDLNNLIHSLNRKYEQGTIKKYISIDTQILGMVLKAATNNTLTNYLQEKIWKSAGFECDFYWLRTTDSSEIELAIGTINACVRDYARFGWLYLNKGKSPLDGSQIISEDWVNRSITPDSDHLMPNADSKFPLGYGYQWWVPSCEDNNTKLCGDYVAIGVYNQFIYVAPQHNIVIAKYSAYANYSHDNIESELKAISAFRKIAQEFSDL